MKKNFYWKKVEKVIVPVAIASLLIGGTAYADGANRRSSLNSHGAVDITSTEGAILIDSADLVTLADEIDTLESTYKSTTKKALNNIGTYIKTDGSITHSAPSSQIEMPSFNQLANAIQNSQSSSSAIADLSSDIYYKKENGALVRKSTAGSNLSGTQRINLAPAAANNLSAGTVAFIDGKLLLGTGADVQTYYDTGYNKGYSQGESSGYSNGYSQGKTEGKNTGYQEGYAQGKAEGENSIKTNINSGNYDIKLHFRYRVYPISEDATCSLDTDAGDLTIQVRNGVIQNTFAINSLLPASFDEARNLDALWVCIMNNEAGVEGNYMQNAAWRGFYVTSVTITIY